MTVPALTETQPSQQPSHPHQPSHQQSAAGAALAQPSAAAAAVADPQTPARDLAAATADAAAAAAAGGATAPEHDSPSSRAAAAGLDQKALLAAALPHARVVAFVWSCIRHIVPPVSTCVHESEIVGKIQLSRPLFLIALPHRRVIALVWYCIRHVVPTVSPFEDILCRPSNSQSHHPVGHLRMSSTRCCHSNLGTRQMLPILGAVAALTVSLAS